MSHRRIPFTETPFQVSKPTFQKNNFADMMVNLSVKDASSVTKRIRLIGVPCPIIEYTDKKYHPTNRGETIREPFPDAHLNRSYTRTGHSDPSQCAWAQMGYIPSVQYIQNVLEKSDDGEWVVKVLKKGKSIFQAFKLWEDGRKAEDLDDDETVYSGVRNSHAFRITANATGKKPPQSVEYKIVADSKPTMLTDEMIEALRKAGEPTPDELQMIRERYEIDRQEFDMPPWEDYFAYGYPLDKIFKYQPPRTSENETGYVAPSKKFKDEDVLPDLEDPIEEDIKKSAKKTTKAVVVQDDDDDEDDLPFI